MNGALDACPLIGSTTTRSPATTDTADVHLWCFEL